MNDTSGLTDQQLHAALRVDHVPVPADLSDRVRAAIANAPSRRRPEWRRLTSAGSRSRVAWLVAAGVLIAALIAAGAFAGLAERGPEVRLLLAELDRGTDPTRTMPVRVRDESGLVTGAETMDRSMPEWLQAEATELHPLAPIQFASPPGDAGRVVVVLLADGVCDASVDLAVSGTADRLRLLASLIPGRPDCGATIGPLWFALDFREPVAVDAITGELTRAGEATSSPLGAAETRTTVAFPNGRSVPVTLRASGIGLGSASNYVLPGDGWAFAREHGVRASTPIAVVGAPDDPTAIVVVWLGDATCDVETRVDLNAGADDDGSVLVSIVGDRVDCGGSATPLAVTIDLQAPIDADLLTAELRRSAGLGSPAPDPPTGG